MFENRFHGGGLREIDPNTLRIVNNNFFFFFQYLTELFFLLPFERSSFGTIQSEGRW